MKKKPLCLTTDFMAFWLCTPSMINLSKNFSWWGFHLSGSATRWWRLFVQTRCVRTKWNRLSNIATISLDPRKLKTKIVQNSNSLAAKWHSCREVCLGWHSFSQWLLCPWDLYNAGLVDNKRVSLSILWYWLFFKMAAAISNNCYISAKKPCMDLIIVPTPMYEGTRNLFESFKKGVSYVSHLEIQDGPCNLFKNL